MNSTKTVAPSAKALDVFGLTVDEVQAGYANGKFSAEDLARSCLENICRYNKTYNAIVFLSPSALDEARAIDRRRSAGERLGPLAGVPMVVKDAIDMIGFPTTAGWSALHSKSGGVDLMPETDAPVVERIRGAGAVILGKTNMPALAYSANDANTQLSRTNAQRPDTRSLARWQQHGDSSRGCIRYGHSRSGFGDGRIDPESGRLPRSRGRQAVDRPGAEHWGVPSFEQSRCSRTDCPMRSRCRALPRRFGRLHHGRPEDARCSRQIAERGLCIRIACGCSRRKASRPLRNGMAQSADV